MLNKVIIMGRLTATPETQTLSSGITKAKFSLACQRDFKNADGEYDADFINCVAWKDTADRIEQFFKKGDLVTFEGRWQSGSYVKQDTNEKVYTNDLVVEKFTFVPTNKKKDEDGDEEEKPKSRGNSSRSRSNDDEEDEDTNTGAAGGFRRKQR